MCLICTRTVTPVPPAHYRAFKNYKLVDHNNLAMDSLLSPLRTPLTSLLHHPLDPSASNPPNYPLSYLFFVLSQPTLIHSVVLTVGR